MKKNVKILVSGALEKSVICASGRPGFSPTKCFAVISMMIMISYNAFATESTCYGTSRKGRIDNALALPSAGNNFISYGREPELAGRTYLHSTVYRIVVAAYQTLEQQAPGKVFKYAETGFQKGGVFPPHKTHQNGSSVDFIVPVLDQANQSVQLPTNKKNRYGYDIEFDNKARYAQYHIDFDALGAHLMALHQAAEREHSSISRVILDPPYHAQLYKSKYGAYLRQHVNLQKKKAWVRHDEHYHVDFKLNCKPL